MKFAVLLLATTGLCPVVSHAQTAPAQPVVNTVDDIVVTAQRRSESQQDVPISIVAITAERLQNTGITTTQDLPIVTPGLVMTNNRNTTTPYIRGVGTQSGTAGTEGAVAVYVDGVYYPSAVTSVFALNNIARIEILKGPQGTLFGRNATGGLLQVVTHDPSDVFEVRGNVGYANYDTTSGGIYVTGALSDRITADLAAYGSYQGDGWGTNFFTGEDVNIRREALVRSKVKFDITDQTSLLLSADYALWRSDAGNVRQPLPGTIAIGGFSPVGSIYDTNSRISLFPDKNSKQYGGSVTLRHDFSDAVSFTSTTAYRQVSVLSNTDTDGTPQILSDSQFHEVGDTFQQEFLLNGGFGRLDWTAGLFYFDASAGWDPLQIRTNPPSPVNAKRYTNVDTSSWAVFAQGTYAITDRTKLTLGARYTEDEKTVSGQFIADVGNTQPVGTVIVDSSTKPSSQTNRSWDAVTWRVALDHELTDNVLVYASANKGFKSGSFNATDPTQPALDPEELVAYEVGLKSDLFGKSLRLNLAAYYYDYTNIQLQTVTGAGSIAFNAPSGKLKGAEVELVWAPTTPVGDLTISSSLSFLDTEYENFPSAPFTTPRNPAAPPFGGNVTGAISADGNDMVRSPPFQSSLTVDYILPVSDTMQAGVNLAWQHSASFFFEVDNRVPQPAYDLVNLQASYGPQDEAWKVRLWARNLLDEAYYSVVNTTAFGDGAVAAAPRTFGVTLDFRFGG